MFAGFREKFGEEIAELLTRLFEGDIYADRRIEMNSHLAGSICARLVLLSKNKTDPFFVANALGEAAQQNPFVDLEVAIWAIKWICKKGQQEKKNNLGDYFKLLFDIAEACNTEDNFAIHVFGLNKEQKKHNKMAGDNQVCILQQTKEYCIPTAESWLAEPMDILSLLKFQVKMCSSPHKQTTIEAQALLGKAPEMCDLYRPGTKEPILPVAMLVDFFRELVKERDEAISATSDDWLLRTSAIQSLAYGVIKVRNVVEIASTELTKWLDDKDTFEE